MPYVYQATSCEQLPAPNLRLSKQTLSGKIGRSSFGLSAGDTQSTRHCKRGRRPPSAVGRIENWNRPTHDSSSIAFPLGVISRAPEEAQAMSEITIERRTGGKKAISGETIQALGQAMRGQLLQPGQEGYDASRT